jgi:hypothetical protein
MNSLGTTASTNFFIGQGDPNGTVSGTINDKYFGTAQNLLWICTQSGTSTTAVWEVVEAAIDID